MKEAPVLQPICWSTEQEDAEQPSSMMGAPHLSESVHIVIVPTCPSLMMLPADGGQMEGN